MTPKHIIRKKKIWSKKIIKTENIVKKELAAAARQRLPKKKQNSEDPSGSIRDITAHLIHDKNTSIALSCTVFNFPSAGNDPGRMYWSYDFFVFFDPGDFGPGGWHRPDPEVKIRRSQGLTP